MRAEPNTDIVRNFKSLSFANNQDFIKALRYTNGVGATPGLKKSRT